MKFMPSFLAALALGLGALNAQAKIVRTVEKTFPAKPEGSLVVRTFGGDVTVETADVDSVKVTAIQTVDTNSEEKADKELKKLTLTLEEKGSEVTARAEFGKGAGFHWTTSSVNVAFKVVVPKVFRVDLETSGGDIRVSDLKGDVRLETSGGDLKLARIDGNVHGETSGGNILIEEGSGKVHLETSGGDIHAKRTGGAAHLQTSGGNISIEAAGGPVVASTSGGNVSAVFEGALKGDCSLETSGGNVSVTVPQSAAFDLDAETSGGDVKAPGLTIQLGGKAESDHLSGRVNGGGPKLKLGTSGGDIRVNVK